MDVSGFISGIENAIVPEPPGEEEQSTLPVEEPVEKKPTRKRG